MRSSPAEMKAQNWQLLTGAIILSLAVIVQCQGRSRILYNIITYIIMFLVPIIKIFNRVILISPTTINNKSIWYAAGILSICN